MFRSRGFGADVEPHGGLAALHAPRIAASQGITAGARRALPQLAAEPGAARMPHRNRKCRLYRGGARRLPLPGRMDSIQLRWAVLSAHGQQCCLVSTLSSPSAIHQANLAPAGSAGVNVAAVYLLPWLAILAAGLLAQAASDGFEWLYPLRLVVALAVFFAYRRHYLQMDWRFGWLGPATGVVVFAFWVAIDHWIGEDMTGRDAAGSGVILTGVAEGLARLSVNQRHVWIALRTLAAVVTVPLAEELAFRGYIARRFMSADVESIPFASLSVFAVVGSSLAFGILHGRMWLAGVMAGLVFAVVAKLRGRLGDAVAAHATANLLLAFWVIARGDYSLW